MSDLSEKSDPSENYKYMKEKNWKLGEIFALHQELPAGCVADLEAAAELVHVPRRRAIVRQGDVCRAFYFNRNGLMRVVHEWDGGEETVVVGMGGDVFTSLHSWHAGLPSIFSLVSVEPTEVYVIGYADMRRLMGCWPQLWQWMCRLLAEQVYGFERRYLFFARSDAEERYRNFMAERPDALRRLSVKVVAQYLHIAPETLSRIRARIVCRKM